MPINGWTNSGSEFSNTLGSTLISSVYNHPGTVPPEPSWSGIDPCAAIILVVGSWDTIAPTTGVVSVTWNGQTFIKDAEYSSAAAGYGAVFRLPSPWPAATGQSITVTWSGNVLRRRIAWHLLQGGPGTDPTLVQVDRLAMAAGYGTTVDSGLTLPMRSPQEVGFGLTLTDLTVFNEGPLAPSPWADGWQGGDRVDALDPTTLTSGGKANGMLLGGQTQLQRPALTNPANWVSICVTYIDVLTHFPPIEAFAIRRKNYTIVSWQTPKRKDNYVIDPTSYEVWASPRISGFAKELRGTVASLDVNGKLDTLFVDPTTDITRGYWVRALDSVGPDVLYSEYSNRALSIQTPSQIDAKEELMDRRIFTLDRSLLDEGTLA